LRPARACIVPAKREKDGLDQTDEPVDRSRAGSAVKPHEFILFALGFGFATLRERPFARSASMSCAVHCCIPLL
jgi:hypothetical protein